METLRVELGIHRWVLFGGSWGSTLSLVYAETHPEKVLGLILRGIFLCRPHEIAWFYQQGTSRGFLISGRTSSSRSRKASATIYCVPTTDA